MNKKERKKQGDFLRQPFWIELEFGRGVKIIITRARGGEGRGGEGVR